MALVSTVLPIGLFFVGLRRVGPSAAATLSTVEPVVTVLLATLCLQEALRPPQVLGGLCILVAVVILARGVGRTPLETSREQRQRDPDSLRAIVNEYSAATE